MKSVVNSGKLLPDDMVFKVRCITWVLLTCLQLCVMSTECRL
jgi:hypothetical protein